MGTNTTLYWKDNFDRDDTISGGETGKGWSAHLATQILDGAVVTTAPSGSNLRHISRESGSTQHVDGQDEYVVMAKVAGAVPDNNDYCKIRLSVRHSESTLVEDGYYLELHFLNTNAVESATLRLKKTVNSVSSTLAEVDVLDECNTASSSVNEVLQNMALRVRDDEDGIVLEAYFNDEERPRLTYTDTSYPMHSRGGYVGVSMKDNAPAEGNTIGFAKILSFSILGLADLQEAGDAIPSVFTFGKLKTILRSRSLRDSSSLVDDEFFGELINEALQEICSQIGRPYWLEDVYTFKTAVNTEEVELPADTLFVDGTIWDTNAKNSLAVMSEEQFRKIVGNSPAGIPYTFRLSGYGPQGGPLLRAYPTPSTSRTYSVRRFRMARYMTNDSAIPDIPQQFAYALIWGGLMSYSMRDSDRTHIQAASAKFQAWVRKIKHHNHRRASIADNETISTGLNVSGFGNTLWESARYGGFSR